MEERTTHLDDANENPERVLLGWMCQEKRGREIVHALTVCEAQGDQLGAREDERRRRTADLGIPPAKVAISAESEKHRRRRRTMSRR